MGVPKKRHTKAQKGKRRAHIKLKKLSLVLCPKCKKAILPHTACPYCGSYAGREVIEIKVKKKKPGKKKEEKTK